MSVVEQANENTDREIWREREGDYYSDAVFITAKNDLGINVGGTVFVHSLRKWQELAVENDRLRAALVQCVAVCDDNCSDDRNSSALALKFVRDVAAKATDSDLCVTTG